MRYSLTSRSSSIPGMYVELGRKMPVPRLAVY
jgi:hypothetical protein